MDEPSTARARCGHAARIAIETATMLTYRLNLVLRRPGAASACSTDTQPIQAATVSDAIAQAEAWQAPPPLQVDMKALHAPDDRIVWSWWQGRSMPPGRATTTAWAAAAARVRAAANRGCDLAPNDEAPRGGGRSS